jgi:hypothetical protein
LLAIRIHSIPNLKNTTSETGSNPFDNLAFWIDDERVRFKEYYTTGWGNAKDVSSMPLGDVTYDLGSMDMRGDLILMVVSRKFHPGHRGNWDC